MENVIELVEAPYVERDGVPLMMTIVRRAGADKLPILMEFHGGGWCGGQRLTHIDVMAKDRADEGYLYLNVEYRLAPFHPYPCALDDVRSAIEWIAAHSADFGGDSDRIGLFGLSAGGHLATMLALTSPVPVRCAVSWGGPCDYTDMSNPDAAKGHESCLLAFLGACHHDKPDLYDSISPVRYLRPDSPSLLMIHGEKDDAVSVYHAKRMRAAAIAVGAPVDSCILPNAGHIDPSPHDPDASHLWPYICNFLAKHLAPSGPVRPLHREPVIRM